MVGFNAFLCSFKEWYALECDQPDIIMLANDARI